MHPIAWARAVLARTSARARRAPLTFLRIPCSREQFGFTALMLAVKSKQPKLIDLLLEVEGVKLDVQTKRGFSALMIAAWKGDNATIDKLVAKGAKIDLKDGGRRNAWGIAHDWHNETTLECLGKHGMTYKSHGARWALGGGTWTPGRWWDGSAAFGTRLCV